MSLAICAIIKDEAPYIEEWLEFHLLQGVEHFYLTDNGSTDDTLGRLVPYMKDNLVTWNRLFTNPGQLKAYKHWIDSKIIQEDWVAFIDVDEFLFSPTEEKVSTIVDSWTEVSAIAVHWMLYGKGQGDYFEDYSSPLIPVIERFTWRAAEVNPHVKSIVRLRDILDVGKDPHTFKVNGRIVDEHFNTLPKQYALQQNGTADILRINHYHTKSWPEYQARKLKNPRPDTGKFIENIEENFKAHDTCEVYDPIAATWAKQVKENIEKRRNS